MRLRKSHFSFLPLILLGLMIVVPHIQSNAQSSIGDQIFTANPGAASLLDKILNRTSGGHYNMMKAIEEIANEKGAKLKMLYKRPGPTFALKGKGCNLIGYYEHQRDFGYETLFFETGELFDDKKGKAVFDKMNEMPGWRGKAKNKRGIYTHIKTGTQVDIEHNPANGSDRAYVVVFQLFDNTELFAVSKFKYDFFNVTPQLDRFPEGAEVLNDCGTRQLRHYGNAIYFGEMKGGVPHDLSGDAALLLYEQDHLDAIVTALSGDNGCQLADFKSFLNNPTKYGATSVVYGKFRDGRPTESHRTHDGKPYVFKKSDKGTIYYGREELAELFFKAGSAERELFDAMVVNNIAGYAYLDYYKTFNKSFPVDQAVKLLGYRRYRDAGRNKQYEWYSARKKEGGNVYEVVATAHDDDAYYFQKGLESSTSGHTNFSVYKGEQDKITFMGYSDCFDIIAAMDAKNLPYYLMDEGHYIVVDLKSNPNALFTSHMVLTFTFNELTKIRVDHDVNRTKASINYGIKVKPEMATKPFCSDPTYVANRLKNSEKIAKLADAPRAGDIIDSKNGICISGCDDPNGVQLIHLGNMVYYGKVKNGVPHDETNTAKFGTLQKRYAAQNLKALEYYDEYKFSSQHPSIAVNGLIYMNVMDYNPSSRVAIKMVDLELLNRTGYTEVVMKDDGLWYPSGNTLGLYKTKKMGGKEDLLYTGKTDGNFKPNGEGVLVWDAPEMGQVMIRGQFDHGNITMKNLELRQKGRIYSNLEAFNLEKDGSYDFSGMAVTMTSKKKDGTEYKTSGAYVDRITPTGTHQTWIKKGSQWVAHKNATFNERYGLQLSGPDFFGLHTAHFFFGIKDQSYGIQIQDTKFVRELRSGPFMPFYKYAKTEIEENGRKKTAKWVDIGKPENGEIRLKPQRVGEGITSLVSGTLHFGNAGDEPAKLLLFEVRMNARDKMAYVEILGELTLEPGRYATHIWDGGEIFGTRYLSGSKDIKVGFLSPFH